MTEDDIRFIAGTGSNTIRIPFHYKLFTNDSHLGGRPPKDGFALIDPVIGWCRTYGLHVVLDMHACPGGQTGDNIDDSYGYPWLFTSAYEQRVYCEIWKRIAAHYADEAVVLGYDLMNEPISSRLKDKDELNKRLEPVLTMALAAIRAVDRRHIVIFAAAQWNSNFASKILTIEHQPGKGHHSKHGYKVFTERGLYMLATILKGEIATRATLAIVNAYADLRSMVRDMESLQSLKDGSPEQAQALTSAGHKLAALIGDNLST